MLLKQPDGVYVTCCSSTNKEWWPREDSKENPAACRESGSDSHRNRVGSLVLFTQNMENGLTVDSWVLLSLHPSAVSVMVNNRTRSSDGPWPAMRNKHTTYLYMSVENVYVYRECTVLESCICCILIQNWWGQESVARIGNSSFLTFQGGILFDSHWYRTFWGLAVLRIWKSVAIWASPDHKKLIKIDILMILSQLFCRISRQGKAVLFI